MSLKSNVIENYPDKDPFWMPYYRTPNYADLNNVNIPTSKAIREYQIKKIKLFSQVAIESRFENLKGAATQDFNSLISEFEGDEQKEVDKALEEVFTALNGLYYVNKNEQKTEQDWAVLQTRLNRVKMALETVISQVQGNNNVILANQLKEVEDALKSCQLESLNSIEVNQFLKGINQFKGSLLEELGVEYIRKLGLPNIESIRLGNVYLNTDGKDGRHKGQLIQDLIAYSISDTDILKNTIIEYDVPIGDGSKKEHKKTTLEEFFSNVEKANGQTKQIVIDDNAYDILLKLQSISIQAKSGKKQLPWNKNKSTSIKLNEFGDGTDGDFQLGLSIQRVFQLLASLNEADEKEKIWSMKDVSKDYNAIANYGLATVMNKVLHLSENGNQYLLTPYGFMSYPQRIEQLFRTEEHIAMIQDNIILNNNVLTTPHKVTIDSSKN